MYIHGMTETPEYAAWCNIKTRCTNEKRKDYDHYGGRGIKMCEKWINSFMAFYEDVGPRPDKDYTLERIDNDKNYEPGNVRWATRAEQGRNQRTNHVLEFNGEILTLADWAKRFDLHRTTIFSRLKAGWSIEKALSTPPSPRRKSV